MLGETKCLPNAWAEETELLDLDALEEARELPLDRRMELRAQPSS